MPTRRHRFRPDADLDGIISELDDRRARAIAAGNHAAIYDRLYDALPAAERESTLAPLRELIRNHADGAGRGARRWITRHQQDLIDYNRYIFVRALLLAGYPWGPEGLDLELQKRLRVRPGGVRNVMKSYSRVAKALRAGKDGRYYFSRELSIGSEKHLQGLRALPDPDLLNALPRL